MNKSKASDYGYDGADSLERYDREDVHEDKHDDDYESAKKSRMTEDNDRMYENNKGRSTRFRNIKSKMAAISVSSKKEDNDQAVTSDDNQKTDAQNNEEIKPWTPDSPKYWTPDTPGPKPVEKDYDDIKNNPNKIWEKYELKVKKITNSLAYMKNFDSNELYQQAYIYFVDLCKNYDPYYQGNFFPFEKYFFKNLIIRIRAHIQGYYFKQKREQPTEFSEYRTKAEENPGDDLYLEYLLSLLPEKQRMIVQLSLIEGYNQQEVGQMIGVSQSRVSVIRKKALTFLKENIEKRKGK